LESSFIPIESCAATQPFAECDGLDLSQELSSDAIMRMRAALLEFGVKS